MSMQMHSRQPYKLVRSRDEGDGRFRTDFEITCKCGATEKVHGSPSSAPEQIFMSFRRKGWHVHERNAKHHICPACIERNGRNSPPTSKPHALKNLAVKVVPHVTESESPTMKQDHDDLRNLSPNPAPAPRAATPKEALAIGRALDEHFDETAGAYKGKHDDKTIGASLDIPWGVVARFREEAGLKIKQDPELLALKSDIEAATGILTDLQRRLAAYEQRRAA